MRTDWMLLAAFGLTGLTGVGGLLGGASTAGVAQLCGPCQEEDAGEEIWFHSFEGPSSYCATHAVREGEHEPLDPGHEELWQDRCLDFHYDCQSGCESEEAPEPSIVASGPGLHDAGYEEPDYGGARVVWNPERGVLQSIGCNGLVMHQYRLLSVDADWADG